MSEGLVQIFSGRELKAHFKNIKCPVHHRVIPGRQPYLIEPNPLMKNFSDSMCKDFGLKKWQYKRDKFGNKIPDYRNHYQPEISAAYAKEKIYRPNNPICTGCRRCFV